MKYGCIGERLGHSYSKEIHGAFAAYDYEIREIPRFGVDAFMRARDFLGINVTIPYKETVIPYLSELDEGARAIGAVNTVVNRGGKLFGYNTDFFGMSELARRAKIDFSGKKVLILGTGGTSKTAEAVAIAQGAREVIKASRRSDNGAILYTDVYKYHTNSEIIINTTPVGMYPNIFDKPIELSAFPNLSGVLDAIYNPEKTPLILEAEKLKVNAEGGLYMLVAQAIRASEHFLGISYSDGLCDEVFYKIRRQKRNIVLIGMPSSGKTTVGKIICEKLRRTFTDTDALIVEQSGMAIPDIFDKHGERVFRDMETAAIRSVAPISGTVIATGGGAPLRAENVHALRQNGIIYFIDRPLSSLMPTEDRPLASSAEAIAKRYEERYDIYRAACDVHIDADCTAEEVSEKILSHFLSG